MTQESLNSQNREIRLATLYPKDHPLPGPLASIAPLSGGIQISLQKVSLNDSPPPQYTTLSYVWGDPNDTIPIIVDGVEFLATKNLVAALSQLQRDNGEPIALWVDALCIKQSDNDEKSSQIQLMKQIYEASSCTIVWLGDDADGSEVVMKMLADFAARPEVKAAIYGSEAANQTLIGETESEAIQLARLIVTDQSIPTDSSHPALLSTQASLAALLNREYWYRVWCLQEISVSETTVIACGNGGHRINVDVFGKIVYYYSQLMSMIVGSEIYKSGLLEQIRNKSPYMSKYFAKSINAATRMLDQRTRYRKVKRQRDEDESAKGSANGSHPMLLDYLIDAYANKVENVSLRSTDPRDMIYGLMNLASDVDEVGIVPDYQKPCEQVFMTIWAAMLRNHGAGILAWAVPEYEPSSPRLSPSSQDMAVPSWVPDWRQPRSFHVLLQCGLFLACGKKHQNTQWVSTDDPRIIALRGVQIDIVQEAGTALNGQTGQHVPSLAVLLDEITQFLETSRLLAPSPEESVYPTPEAIHSARWRIPLCDLEGTSDILRPLPMSRATSTCEESFRSVLASLEGLKQATSDGVDDPAANWSVTLRQHLQGLVAYTSKVFQVTCLRPFLTARGWVGRGPGEMKAGDVVVILWGCCLPLVLRPCDGGGDGRDQKYQLVGDAYVHGLMDGEFVQGDVEREERTFRLC